MDDSQHAVSVLPLVVQLGFAGSRRLVDLHANPAIDAAEFEKHIEDWLVQRLHQLRLDLGLEEHHFFCGISALAIGGDTIFSHACQKSGISQRIFLPQTHDEFLAAEGSEGPDFSPAQKERALHLLNSRHVIQERLASDSSKRAERFEDVNREIVRVSDVLICLLREESQGQSGGTRDLIQRAAERGKPVLVIHVGVSNGKPVFSEQWHLPENLGPKPATPATVFTLPQLPHTLLRAHFPKPSPGNPHLAEPYASEIKRLSSRTAARMRARFKRMALTIVLAHIVATLFASVALASSDFRFSDAPVFALLILELLMLILGYWMHRRLHRTHTLRRWAESRLLAEVARSVLAVGNLHLYMEHLFSLPFPKALRPVLRTINVLHLGSTRHDRENWKTKRDHYIETRLNLPQKGQIDFYSRRAHKAGKFVKNLHICFNIFWWTAFLSTIVKLINYIKFDVEWLNGVLGILAIVMPVLAAAALSFAGALDLEAQEHTYHEMMEFLKAQERYLRGAASERDYARLVLETESHLLGETANWFSRRSFTSVA